jgi:hypothetical protein
MITASILDASERATGGLDKSRPLSRQMASIAANSVLFGVNGTGTARANLVSCSKLARSARSRLYELRISNCSAHRSNGIRSCRHKGEGTQKSPQCWGWCSTWRVLHRLLAALLHRLIHQFRPEVSLSRYVLEGSASLLEEISRSLN